MGGLFIQLPLLGLCARFMDLNENTYNLITKSTYFGLSALVLGYGVNNLKKVKKFSEPNITKNATQISNIIAKAKQLAESKDS